MNQKINNKNVNDIFVEMLYCHKMFYCCPLSILSIPSMTKLHLRYTYTIYSLYIITLLIRNVQYGLVVLCIYILYLLIITKYYIYSYNKMYTHNIILCNWLFSFIYVYSIYLKLIKYKSIILTLK